LHNLATSPTLVHHEKMTDVNISVELMTDAFRDLFDTALLVSADSDLVGVVRAVRQFFRSKRTVIALPPGSGSKALVKAAVFYWPRALFPKP
jgi:uncharacterized LabA/DUF88 family protein